MSMIRRLNINTGAPATEADENAGLAHWVQCDHQGNIVRDENRAAVSYGGPETRGAGLSRQIVETLRNSPQRAAVPAETMADQLKQHEAVKAEFEARFGAGAVRPRTGHL